MMDQGDLFGGDRQLGLVLEVARLDPNAIDPDAIREELVGILPVARAARDKAPGDRPGPRLAPRRLPADGQLAVGARSRGVARSVLGRAGAHRSTAHSHLRRPLRRGARSARRALFHRTSHWKASREGVRARHYR